MTLKSCRCDEWSSQVEKKDLGFTAEHWNDVFQTLDSVLCVFCGCFGLQISEIRMKMESRFDREQFKAPYVSGRGKRPVSKTNVQMMNFPHKKKSKRTSEDFLEFCSMVLSYTQYDSNTSSELLQADYNREEYNTSPLDSTGTADSFISLDSTGTADSFISLDSTGTADSFISLDSTGTADSFISDASNLSYASSQDNNSFDEDDSMDLITCFCMKPYAGRPMIECNDCNIWIHLSCAKIRKTNIPEKFTCQRCREARLTTRKSSRTKLDPKQIVL